jgi:hypothetical protein
MCVCSFSFSSVVIVFVLYWIENDFVVGLVGGLASLLH